MMMMILIIKKYIIIIIIIIVIIQNVSYFVAYIIWVACREYFINYRLLRLHLFD